MARTLKRTYPYTRWVHYTRARVGTHRDYGVIIRCPMCGRNGLSLGGDHKSAWVFFVNHAAARTRTDKHNASHDVADQCFAIGPDVYKVRRAEPSGA